jgi:hypothetical protein
MRKLSVLMMIVSIIVLALSAASPAMANDQTPDSIWVKNITANGSFSRVWNWTIVKSADQLELLLSPGESFPVNYTVTVSPTSSSGWQVAGTFQFRNMFAIPVTITNISVDVGGVPATVTCVEVWLPNLPSGYTVPCSFSASGSGVLPGGVTTTVTAGGINYTDSTLISYADPTSETDECIDVSDTNVGSLGTVCAGDVNKTFTYALSFGTGSENDVVLVCGENTHPNIASFVTNDTGATGEANWTVNANVACGGGCTLTQGYWKTHSQLGPAPYDPAWLNLGSAQEQTTFFLSGKTWYQVFWTAPAGNAYYILAHQYMAAKLNVLDGASASAVTAVLASTETLFNTYTPAQVTNANKAQFTSLAATLDSYNNGLIGPGHCSE